MGNVTKEVTEGLLTQFISQMSLTGALMGTSASTERLLAEFIPEERLKVIMEERAAPNDLLAYAILFAFYFVNYFVIVFFNSALVGCAIIRFKGGDHGIDKNECKRGRP